ncbi:hypothetical protein GCM10011578_086110 [Streptomyces fuscichromogenes]|uniref:Uncharacterized protein n=1 Tax=Streptomyces fuscichromogenes TaxID=1324013 RepID=A0A917XMK7_9ACTN|nr:hypothetical protein GCM10011578_086110 [Streptomyces fuscichromogenes]
MAHWREESEKPSARWASGSATFTTVTSSAMTSCASDITARTHQRRRSDMDCVLAADDADFPPVAPVGAVSACLAITGSNQ